jgi:hypothetical protein
VLVPLIKFHCMDEVRTGSMDAMPHLLEATTLAMQSGAAPNGEQLFVGLKVPR